jgi:hypothetical protein
MEKMDGGQCKNVLLT